MKDAREHAVEEYAGTLERMSAPEWTGLPDIGLYMDQVINYLTRLIEPYCALQGEQAITPSMINNYVKAKVIPRAEGKKYSQEHLALLLMIMTLKKSLSVQDIRTLLDERGGEATHRDQYERYRKVLDAVSKSVASEIRAELGALGGEHAEKLKDLALRFSLEAGIRSLAAERIIDLLR